MKLAVIAGMIIAVSLGQDPDPNIRFTMRKIQFGINCGG